MYFELPVSLYAQLINTNNFVLLETSKYDEKNLESYLFINPVDTIKIYSVTEVPSLFFKIEHYLKQNYYLAGYLGYECGYHFEEVFSTLNVHLNYPVAWFGVYERPIVFNHLTGKSENYAFSCDLEKEVLFNEFMLENFEFNIPEVEYVQKIEKIKDYISNGDVYQINLTGKYKFRFSGSALALYDSLKKKQNVSYGAFINTEDLMILSLSPELFLKIDEDRIATKPMKGTARRGKTIEEDEILKEALRGDEKNRAENLMIVDLLRNDIGRISKFGSVHVSELFSVEKYQTLFQMTSTVEGKIRENSNYYELFRAIFPGGSVTGAPKIRAMEIIHELEGEPRGIYTGAIGFISPEREAVFNIAIRTVVIQGDRGEMGTGGGIVWDSDPEAEYEECRLKANFLTTPYEEFELLETILWSDEYFLLEKHLERLEKSAEYFDYPFSALYLASVLDRENNKFEKGRKYKVRLLLSRYGQVQIESNLLEDNRQTANLAIISPVRSHSNDLFLYHKTTKRNLYDRAYRDALSRGFIEVVFMNEKEQITEGAISNIFIRKGENYYTPPVECGLLKGIYRQYLLETLPNVEEKILYLDDLKNADSLLICNSVRGIQEVKIDSILNDS
ncbi:MAG: aminodeoxychorismate synthase component I [Nitrospirota bacterium]|nr:aminodeoxychorismate synthase component I [Nitrospirota bacterium]